MKTSARIASSNIIEPALRAKILRQVDHLLGADLMAGGAQAQLRVEEIQAVRTPQTIVSLLRGVSHVSLGVDPGLRETHTLVLGALPEGELALLHCERLPPSHALTCARLIELARRFKPDSLSIDANSIGAELYVRIREAVPSLAAFAIFFDSGEYTRIRTADRLVAHENNRLVLSKPRVICEILRNVRRKRILIPDQLPDRPEFEASLMALSVEQAPRGQKQVYRPSPKWHSENDHYFCAMACAVAGLEVSHG